MPEYVYTPQGAVLPTANPAAYSDPDGTNFTYPMLSFDDTTDESVYFTFPIDTFYNSGTIYFDIWWKGANTVNDVVWQVNLLGRIDDEVFDSALGTANYIADTAKGTAHDIAKCTIEVSTTGLVPSDFVILKLSRDADSTNATDNFVGDALFLGMRMRFEVAV